MGVVNYLTIDGEIVSETRNGVKSDYIPDPLGSTSKLVNTSQTVTDVFEYWPYGELKLHTGGSGTPFRFGGTLGYYTHSPLTRLYVRARWPRVDLGRWQTVDPSWPWQPTYAYSFNRPITLSDPSGLQVAPPGCGCQVTGCNAASNQCVLNTCFGCYNQPGGPNSSCISQCNQVAQQYYAACPGKAGSPSRGPGTRWYPISGVGVAPSGPGGPPVGSWGGRRHRAPHYFRPYPRYPLFPKPPEDCVGAAGGGAYPFNIFLCMQCCDQGGGSPDDIAYCSNECADWGRWINRGGNINDLPEDPTAGKGGVPVAL